MSILTMLVIEIANNAQKHVFERKLGQVLPVSLRPFSNNRAVLLVEDDAPGWSPGETVGTDRRLGLSIIQGLATELGGDLRIRSEQGTEVEVDFPILAPCPPAASPSGQSFAPGSDCLRPQIAFNSHAAAVRSIVTTALAGARAAVIASSSAAAATDSAQ
jgi:hypothetical protein